MTLLNNPFVTSGYIAPEYFCDREKETEELLRWLVNENNVAIISTRRMGKTGLILNNRGEVLYGGDVRRQTERMWENVEALLKEADCGFGDVGHIIVYLRDIADYAVVKEMFDKRFPDIPRVVTLAPVCRPGWLVEMECMAVKKISD